MISSWDWSSTSHIDWSFYSYLSKKNGHCATFYIKWSHRFLPVGHVVHRRNPRHSRYCPACGRYEDHDHRLLCDHPSRHPLNQDLIKNLRSRLDRSCFNPILCDILLKGILSVIHSHPFPIHLFPVSYHPLCISQCNLGWANLLEGFYLNPLATSTQLLLYVNWPNQDA